MGSPSESSGTDAAQGPIPLVINGKDVVTETTFPKVGPLENKQIWTASAASEADAIAAADAAQAAFPAWSKTKPSRRRDIFLRAADIMDKRRVELGEYMRQEVGANQGYQDFILGLAIEGLKDTAGKIADACTGSVPDSIHDGMRAIVYKRPYGVVLGIAPWNAAYHLGLRAVTFALAAGNTTVLKGSELLPKCYWAMVDVFREAGLPDGCLNLVLHRPEDASAITNTLIAHPAVRKINFTGSSRVGSIVSAEAGRHLKPVLMELGGKSNAVVLADADLEKAALHCAVGAFINAGQICMSTERILVHSSVAEQFESAFKASVDKIFGSAPDTPMLITAGSVTRNQALVQDAVSKGAKTLGLSPELDQGKVPTQMRPVILTNVNPTMDLYGGESFGPSVSIYTFETEDDMVELANDTEYGLAASIYSEDLRAAFRIADRLESGAVHINSMTVHDEFALPHGGVKKSGFGRFNGTKGLEEFLYCKSVTWME
ncbi:aldehyde dehydrogenase [Colletotrichum higginsianum]|uniref:Aldehyde dehydrogenase n=2 Tax=Colletotrichum higginsianum TaxID=80884 RepID=H1UWS9_COLHI|nr:Aldehyde dehydrogenase [Colletotrichum higginsianum IMI 349063]OBR03245.1 Aldehyde dehydrogenase [Colletotrichum higginsianum IMI 349063]TIC89980.1 Vanillin dehydrogenase [Colletotrichum higginsianum]CCF32430.1 aldehyde dehydrogenase [Colletotrichum higginsianum]